MYPKEEERWWLSSSLQIFESASEGTYNNQPNDWTLAFTKSFNQFKEGGCNVVRSGAGPILCHCTHFNLLNLLDYEVLSDWPLCLHTCIIARIWNFAQGWIAEWMRVIANIYLSDNSKYNWGLNLYFWYCIFYDCLREAVFICLYKQGRPHSRQ